MTYEEDLQYAKNIDRIRLGFLNNEFDEYFKYGHGSYSNQDGIIIEYEYYDDDKRKTKVFNTDTEDCDFDVSRKYHFLCYDSTAKEFEINESDYIVRQIYNFDLIPEDFTPEMHFQYSLIYNDTFLTAVTVFWYLRYVVKADTFFLKFEYVDECIEILDNKNDKH